jgi:hypothetical protein
LDRIVEIELSEMGFADPVLAGRRKGELRALFRSDLEACIGRRLPEGALQCVRQSRTTEQLSHSCLR